MELSAWELFTDGLVLTWNWERALSLICGLRL
jgi:hypothetical protein